MAEEDKRKVKPAPPETRNTKQERLANALRSNLLRRKENMRARKSVPKGSEEGGQG